MDVLDQTITRILEDTPQSPFIPGRYPFTYAYDFFRSHSDHFGETTFLSRGEASRAIASYAENIGEKKFDVVLRLADAYLIENNVQVTTDQKEASLVAARHDYWKACGLTEPGPAPATATVTTQSPPMANQTTDVARAWDEGYMRGRHPWRTSDPDENDPIPDSDSPPMTGRNANPYRQAEPTNPPAQPVPEGS